VDPDGDGYGWENNASCLVRAAGERPVCRTTETDPDGDGWGFENNQSCIVTAATRPVCTMSGSDPDGDGWGFENNTSCVVTGRSQNTTDSSVMTPDTMMGDAMVMANPEAVFVTPEMVNFQDTPFPGVQLANAFSNDNSGSHETFVKVEAGGEIPPHTHTQGTYSMVFSGPMQIPVPLDEMNPMSMEPGSSSFVPPATEHLMGCLTPADSGEDCIFLIQQDGPFDVFPTGSATFAAGTGTAMRNPLATELPFDMSDGFVEVLPGVEFRAVVGDFSVADGSQHGTIVRVQGGMGIPPHYHSLQARGFVLRGDVEVPVPYNQTNPATIQPGGYFAVPAMAVHEMNCASATPCMFYLRQDGDFDFTPVDTGSDAMADVHAVSVILDRETTVPPANVEGASGEVNFSINTASGAISGQISVTGLSGAATAAHIHSGAPGHAGPVILGLESNEDGSVWSVPAGAAPALLIL